MRPRVFPAEDVRPGEGHEAVGGASMRPRVFPAEDPTVPFLPPVLAAASMRPRVFPAEDAVRIRSAIGRPGFNEAAGIPRGRPARIGTWRTRRYRFNEAAGIPRGRPASHTLPRSRSGASMRPRVFPAEDLVEGDRGALEQDGFNEAAGIPRGRPSSSSATGRDDDASMRPRVFPAEDPAAIRSAARSRRRLQ